MEPTKPDGPGVLVSLLIVVAVIVGAAFLASFGADLLETAFEAGGRVING